MIEIEGPFKPGLNLGRTRLDRIVAAGGFGLLHLGYHGADEAPVAVKIGLKGCR